MTLSQLQYALAVFNHQHFGKAAEACHVTQPTLSMQVQKLEDELGVSLFHRERHPVLPTEVGLRLLTQAQKVMDEARKIEDMVRELRGSLTGDFRLAIIPTLAPSLLYRIIPKLKKTLPEVRFHIVEMQTERIIEALERHEVDAGLLATPLGERQLKEQVLFYEPFMAFIPEGHRLSEEAFVLHSELKIDDLLLLTEGHCFRNSVLKLCKENSGSSAYNKRQIELESGNFDALLKLSKLGMGMTLLPYLTAADLPKSDQKHLKPLDHPVPTREISLVVHQTQVRKKLTDQIAEIVKAAVPDRLLNEKNKVISPF